MAMQECLARESGVVSARRRHRRHDVFVSSFVLAMVLRATLLLALGAAAEESSSAVFSAHQDGDEAPKTGENHWIIGNDENEIEALEIGRTYVRKIGADEGMVLDDSNFQRKIVGEPSGFYWRSFIGNVMKFVAGEQEELPEVNVGRSVCAAILIAMSASACSAAGLGGGALFVPIINLVLQFSAKKSAVLSNVVILGGTSVGVALSLIRSHPTDINKPLVDFDIAILLQPNMLLGISIGVFLNKVLPNWFITVVLTALLIYITILTTKKGLKRWDAESRKALAKGRGKRGELRRSNTATEKALNESLLGYYKSLSSRYPVNTILALLLVWLVIFAVQILRGGFGKESLAGIQECGVGFWLLTASQIPVALGITIWVIYSMPETSHLPETSTTNGQEVANSQDEPFVLGRKKAFALSGMALLAGVLAGMLGIGGAMIINPLLLSAGMLPQVTAATTLFTVFFSSSMSVAQYGLMGSIPAVYALVGASISAVFSALGILGLQRIINKYRRPSLIVFVVAGVLGISTIFMVIFGSLDVWNQYKSGADMGFTDPC